MSFCDYPEKGVNTFLFWFHSLICFASIHLFVLVSFTYLFWFHSFICFCFIHLFVLVPYAYLFWFHLFICFVFIHLYVLVSFTYLFWFHSLIYFGFIHLFVLFPISIHFPANRNSSLTRVLLKFCYQVLEFKSSLTREIVVS